MEAEATDPAGSRKGGNLREVGKIMKLK